MRFSFALRCTEVVPAVHDPRLLPTTEMKVVQIEQTSEELTYFMCELGQGNCKKEWEQGYPKEKFRGAKMQLVLMATPCQKIWLQQVYSVSLYGSAPVPSKQCSIWLRDTVNWVPGKKPSAGMLAMPANTRNLQLSDIFYKCWEIW